MSAFSGISVDSVELSERGELLVGAALDVPAAGSQHGAVLSVIGWVVGRGTQAMWVEAFAGDKLVADGPVDRPRPDLAPGEPAPVAGFELTIGAFKVPTTFDVRVIVWLGTGEKVELGRLSGTRRAVAAPSPDLLQPVVIRCLGRTGSTWLLRLLGSHPRVVSYRPFECEARPGGYWSALFETVTSSASLSQLLDPSDVTKPFWWIGHNDERRPVPSPVAEWAGDCHSDVIADFCRGRIESFYREVAGVGANARYFAEKLPPGGGSAQMAELYPDMRELILVRDFRDMVASTLAFNEKRGYLAFGRQRVATDAEYVEVLAEDASLVLGYWEEDRDSCVLVRYEDLILRPEPTLRTIFECMAVEADESTIAQVLATAGEPLEQMDFHRTSPDQVASVGRGLALPADLLALVEDRFGDSLRRFGYA